MLQTEQLQLRRRISQRGRGALGFGWILSLYYRKRKQLNTFLDLVNYEKSGWASFLIFARWCNQSNNGKQNKVTGTSLSLFLFGLNRAKLINHLIILAYIWQSDGMVHIFVILWRHELLLFSHRLDRLHKCQWRYWIWNKCVPITVTFISLCLENPIWFESELCEQRDKLFTLPFECGWIYLAITYAERKSCC